MPPSCATGSTTDVMQNTGWNKNIKVDFLGQHLAEDGHSSISKTPPAHGKFFRESHQNSPWQQEPSWDIKVGTSQCHIPGLHRCHTQVRDVNVHMGVRCQGLHRCEMLRFTQVQDVKVYTDVRCKCLHRCEI